jgi:ATP-binding cassette subfamily B protein
MTDKKRANQGRPVAHFRPEWKVITASGTIASLSAFAEAAALVLVVSMAEALSGNLDELQPTFGPVSLEMSFIQVFVVASALLILSAIGRIGSNYVAIRRRTQLTRQWRLELIEGYLASNYEYESSMKRGQVLETIGQQSSQGTHVLELLAMALNSILTMVIFAAAAFAIQPLVAGTLLIGGGLLLLTLRPVTRRVRQLSAVVAELDIRLGNQADEVVRMARDIKLFDADRHFVTTMDETAVTSARADRRRNVFAGTVPVHYQTTGLLLLLVSLVVAAELGGATIAAMGGSAVLLLRGISYGQRLSTFQQNIAKALPYVDSVKGQLVDYRRNSEAFGDETLDAVETLELEDVSYHYEKGGPPAIHHASLVVKEPGIIGLVGASGSGKSTLAQLMLRLRRPAEGRVIVNGTDTQMYAPDSWRRAVSFVPQEAELIHGSVLENVAFFRPWVTREQVEVAIEAVGLTEHVKSLPDGLDSQIGPTVRDFSGGQKQRIGIARALVGNPSFFVLDEPTSALDAESEQWVMRALSGLRSSGIVIIITHRESTMAHCDMLIHLSSGQITHLERNRP